MPNFKTFGYIKIVLKQVPKNRLLAHILSGRESCFCYILLRLNHFKLFKFFIGHVLQLSYCPMGQFLHIRIIKIRQGSFYILYDLTSNFRQ